MSMRRLPGALATVPSATVLPMKLCTQVAHIRIVVPEKHVLDVGAPDEVFDAQNLKVALRALEVWHQEAALCIGVGTSRQHISKQVVKLVSSAGYCSRWFPRRDERLCRWHGGTTRIDLRSGDSGERARWRACRCPLLIRVPATILYGLFSTRPLWLWRRRGLLVAIPI